MTLTTVAWLVGTAGIVFAVWEVVRRIRSAAAHIRHCIDTFVPAARPADRSAAAPQGDAP